MNKDTEKMLLRNSSRLLYRVIGHSLSGIVLDDKEIDLINKIEYKSTLDNFLKMALSRGLDSCMIDIPSNLSLNINKAVNDLLCDNLVCKDIHVLNWIKEIGITLLQGTVNHLSRTDIDFMINDFIKVGLVKYIPLEQVVDKFSNPIMVSVLITTVIPYNTLKHIFTIKYVSDHNLPIKPVNALPETDSLFHDIFSNQQQPVSMQRPYRDTISPNMDGFNNIQHGNSYRQDPMVVPQHKACRPSRVSDNFRSRTTNKHNVIINNILVKSIVKYFLVTNPRVEKFILINDKQINEEVSNLDFDIEYTDHKFIYNVGEPELDKLMSSMLLNRWFRPTDMYIVEKLNTLIKVIYSTDNSIHSYSSIINYIQSQINRCDNDKVSPLVDNILKCFLDDLVIFS